MDKTDFWNAMRAAAFVLVSLVGLVGLSLGTMASYRSMVRHDIIYPGNQEKHFEYERESMELQSSRQAMEASLAPAPDYHCAGEKLERDLERAIKALEAAAEQKKAH